MGNAWTSDRRNPPRFTKTITVEDYVAFFHQYFGFTDTNNPVLAPFANAQCSCKKYLMGSDGAWDHANSCLDHARNWYCTHSHILRVERICNDAGFSTQVKMVLTSAGNQHADLEVLNIRVAQQTDLLVYVTLSHDFVNGLLELVFFEHVFRSLRVPQSCCGAAQKIALLALSNVAERGIGIRGHALAMGPSHCDNGMVSGGRSPL